MENESSKSASNLSLTAGQSRIVAAALSVLSFTLIAAFVAFVGWFVVKALSYTAPAVTPVIVALFLSMLFKPYYMWIVRRLRNPSLSMAVMFATVLVPLGLLIWFGGSMIVEQAMNLVKSAPTIVSRTSEWLQTSYPGLCEMLRQFGADGDPSFFSDPEGFSRELISSLGASYGVTAVRFGFDAIKYVFSMLSYLLVIVFMCAFLVSPQLTGKDYVEQLPFLKKDTQLFIAEQIDSFTDILVSFFRRQVVICIIEGALYGTGFMLVGLPYGFLLGAALGILNLIPFFGSIVCLSIALPLAYFGDGGSSLRLFGVLGVWIAGQLADGYYITPKIQGKSTGLGYAGVIFSFIFWGTVFRSFLGLLLAIPLSAFCLVLWRALKRRYIKGVI